MSKCKSCGAEIVFIRTTANKYMPCNAELIPYKQTDDGKEYVMTEEGDLIRCTTVFEGFPTGMARTPHWATCPQANQHRRSKNDG